MDEFELSFSLYRPEFPEDVIRIQKVMMKNGYLISFKEAEELWKKRSWYWDAVWLMLPKKDEDLYNSIIDFLEQTDQI